MTMTSFLQRMIWRGGENDRHNATVAETQFLAVEEENKKLTVAMSDWLENRSQSVSNIPEVATRPRRPSTLRLFGSSKKILSDAASCQSYDLQNSKTTSNRLVEDVVKEFEDNYKSPTKTPSKKSRNFVKRLVAALERKNRENDADDVFNMSYSCGPIYAYEQSGTLKKSETNFRGQNKADDHLDEIKNFVEKTGVKAQDQTASSKTMPKIVGAFLKKPVEVDDTSIYWIPITSGKKLPRKKSFKKLLAKLTGKNGGKRSETKTKQVVFASQTNLIEEIHDSGYEERSSASSRTSSLTSFAETLMYHDNNYVDKAYRDCNFSSFVTSSPLKKPEVSNPQLVKTSKDLSKLFPGKEVTSEVPQICEDSGYISYNSILEDSVPKKNLVATRVQQISYQLAKLPKHPFARSEPRLYQQNYDEPTSCGEIITLRRCRDEPVYDVPQPRPRSSIFDESLSMKRRNVPIQAVAPFGLSGRPIFSNLDDDEQPHYATVKPRNNRTRFSYDNLCPNVFETPEETVQDPTNSKKSLHSSFADLTANESFVISMYV